MKSLMLLNPRKRHRRKSRRTRRNPLVASRKGSKTTYRFKASKSSTSKRRYRSKRVSVKVRHLRGSKRTAVVYVRANPRRRSHRRGGFRMNPFSGTSGGVVSQLKGAFSKENFTIAAGGVGSIVLTKYLLAMKKADNTSLLPTPASPAAAKAVKVTYAVGIPLLGALLTRKMSPNLAKGMVISGLISGITEAIKQYAPTQATTLGLGEYLQYTPTSSVGALPPSYMAASRFASPSVRPMNAPLSNASAFPRDAWGDAN
jgi:hypothetical protein